MPLDFKDFEKKKGSKRAASTGYWWEKQADDVWKGVMDTARHMAQSQVERYQLNLRCARLYGNFDFLGFTPKEYGKSATFSPIAKANQISWNLISSCVDTLEAKIGKTTPRPAFLTTGGNWKQQQAAKKLDGFVRGWFYETKMQELMARVFKDGLILDVAALHGYIDSVTKRVRVERVLAHEFRWDEAEAAYGGPRQMFRVKYVAKDVVKGTWGKNRPDVLRALAQAGPMQMPYGSTLAGVDMVEVVEAWHLRSTPKDTDGLHALCIEGCNLVEPSAWDMDRLPFSFYRFSDRLQGFSGQSLSERLTGRQLEINRTLLAISEVLRRKGRGRVYVPRGAKVLLQHLTNGVGDIVEYDGPNPPQHDAAPAVAAEDINYLRMLWADGFEESGISQLSASSKNPFGADPSGEALKTFNDIESERFIMQGKRREALALDVAELGIALVKKTVEESGEDYEVTTPEKRGVSKVRWQEIDLERDDYIMQMSPVSSLPQTFSAKVQTVEKLSAMGVIKSEAQRMRLLDMPDLAAEDNLATAGIDYVDAIIYETLEGKEGEAPDLCDYCPLELFLERGQNALLRATLDGAPEGRLDTLRNLLTAAAEKVAAAQPPPGPPPGGPTVMDGAMPPPPGGPPMGPPGLPPGGPPPGMLPQ